MITLLYPLFDAQFVNNRKQLYISECNDSSAKYKCNTIDV